MKQYSADVIVVGAGLAGLVTTLELVKQQQRVIVIDARPQSDMGGLANWAFGGMALVGTPEQQSKGIADSQELALSDWLAYADFSSDQHWPRAWAEYYIERCIPDIYEYIRDLKIKFLPAVNWAERTGNTVPRYHILWGCSLRLITQLKRQLAQYSHLIDFHFEHRIQSINTSNGTVIGCASDSAEFSAPSVVMATGGFGGSASKVKQHWPAAWSEPKQTILNGCHPANDGKLAEQATSVGAQLTQMENMWNYAAGIRHPEQTFADRGLSLIPCRSALWITPQGERVMPALMGGNDTVALCHAINELQIPYSWQILNRAIALKEFAVSGSEHNVAIRDRRLFRFIRELVFGNRTLVDQMCAECEDFVVADSLEELADKMAKQTSDHRLDKTMFSNTVKDFDALLQEQPASDTQIKTLHTIREYMPDKFRTLKPQSLLAKPPYIAINVRLISRKSMGGIMTNLQSQALNAADEVITGLYCVGEAAGFGGGGSSGKKSLEGTFLSGCILTARQAARSLL